MGKNYSVVRVAQYTRESIGMAERHIERKNQSYENMNVDSSRSYKNVHFKSSGDLTYKSSRSLLAALDVLLPVARSCLAFIAYHQGSVSTTSQT